MILYTQVTSNIHIAQPLDYSKLGNYGLKYAQSHVWLSILHFSHQQKQ